VVAEEPRPAPWPGLRLNPEAPAGLAVVPVRLARDGSTWRIGTDAEVAWIVGGTSISRAITAAIPPVFDAYATVVLPDSDEERKQHDLAVSALLSEHSPGQAWWLGYLDTGVDDIVFPGAPMVTLYAGWHYVLVEAGPEQAATWRRNDPGSYGVLPNLMFPADRSWLVSTLWDDDWSCIGGPAGLVGRFLHHPDLRARPVTLGQDATPPGRQAL
jgi:hypothetical protein